MGGAEHFLLDYFKHVDFDKYEIILGTTENPYKNYLNDLDLPVEVVKLPEIAGNNDLRIFHKYWSFFRAIGPDCVIFNQFELKSFLLPEVIAAWLITRNNAFMILHSQPEMFQGYQSKLHLGFLPGLGLQWRKRRYYQKVLIKFCRKMLVVSELMREALVKNFAFPKRKIETVNHGVDTQLFKPSLINKKRIRAQLKIPSEDIVIVSTCRLAPIKRVDRIISSFITFASERKDIHLLIVGTGIDRNKLHGLVEKIGGAVMDRVYFLGFQKDVLGFLQASDVYMLTSDSEGFPIATLEAMSCGLVPIVTACGGPQEIIQNGITGYLTEKNTVGVKQGLREVLNLNKSEMQLIAANCRKMIAGQYELESRVRNAFRILDMLN